MKRLLVRIRPGVASAAARLTAGLLPIGLTAASVHSREKLDPATWLVECDNTAVAALQADPELQVEEEQIYRQTSGGWHIDAVSGGRGQQRRHELTGAGITCYLIDGEIHPSQGEVIARFAGNGSPGPHGTPVASLIVDPDLGMAPGVNLKAVTIFGEDGTASTSDLLRAFATIFYRRDSSQDSRIACLNCSFEGGKSEMLEGYLERLRQRGVVIFASAGNSGAASPYYAWPAGSPHVLAIGACTENSMLASFTNTSSIFMEQILYAPGVEVPARTQDLNVGSYNGTSFSSPMATAVGCLWAEALSWLDPTIAAQIIHEQMWWRALVGMLNGGGREFFPALLYAGSGQMERWKPVNYWRMNLDVWKAQVRPALHYRNNGYAEDRPVAAPSRRPFEAGAYKLANADVFIAGIDPAVHFRDYGTEEIDASLIGRPLFLPVM